MTHGRSTEAEIRNILESTVCPPERLRMGTALADLSRRIGLTDGDIALLEQARDKSPAMPVNFESLYRIVMCLYPSYVLWFSAQSIETDPFDPCQ